MTAKLEHEERLRGAEAPGWPARHRTERSARGVEPPLRENTAARFVL